MSPLRAGPGGFYARRVKRVMDVGIASTALVVLSPVLLAAALAVRATLGAPILFRQSRPGIGEQPFTLVKLRTMRDARDAQGNLLSDADRLTPLGRTLRRWSLDELPELWNVIRGEMSLVGPRPLLPEYSPYYTPAERRRFLVRPGITGLAQVRGRNDLSWEQRFSYDVWYVDHCSFHLDVQILAATIGQVIARKSVYPDSRSHRLDFDADRAQSTAATRPGGAGIRR